MICILFNNQKLEILKECSKEVRLLDANIELEEKAVEESCRAVGAFVLAK